MSRISEILKKARYSLSDLDGDRWTDERLVYLLDEAQKQLIHKTGSLKQIYNLDAYEGQRVYTLSDDVVTINRVEYKQTKLQFIDMDKFYDIMDNSKNPMFCIYDKLDRNNFVIYPTPEEDADNAIAVYATIMPPTISSTTDEDSVLKVSSIYDNAMYYYIVYSALLDSQDTESLQVASEFKNKYLTELRYLFKESSSDFTDTSATNNYKGFV